MDSRSGLCVIESCILCKLRSDGFFCSLPRPPLEAFQRIKHPASYPSGAVVFLEGQAPRGIYILCQGQAKLSTTGIEGHTLILKIANPGEVLGLHTTITGKPYELTVETMQPCQLNFIRREDFMNFLKQHADACLRAAQHVSHDLHSAYALIRSICLSHSVSERLARLLLERSSHASAAKGPVRVKLGCTHEEISELIGCSRETVTRTISDMRKDGIVDVRRSDLIIRNKAALQRLVAS